MGARFYGFTFQMFYFQGRGTLHFVNIVCLYLTKSCRFWIFATPWKR